MSHTLTAYERKQIDALVNTAKSRNWPPEAASEVAYDLAVAADRAAECGDPALCARVRAVRIEILNAQEG